MAPGSISDVVLDPPVRGGHERDAVLDVQPADDARRAPLDDLDDPRLAAARAGRSPDGRTSTGSPCMTWRISPGGEIEVRAAVVGHHEAVAVRVRLDAPAHDVDLPRDEDRALAVAQDLPVALHRGEAARERLRLLADVTPSELREPPLVDRDRLLLERLQDELAARQRLGIALGFARAVRIRGTAARALAGDAGRYLLTRFASLSETPVIDIRIRASCRGGEIGRRTRFRS